MVLGEVWLGADAAVGVVVRRAFGDTLTAAELRTRFGLTPREVEVVWLLARGDSNAAVACALGVSPCTARHYTEHALCKLGVRSRAQVAAAIRRTAAADSHQWERVSR
jgi:DNA-binding NarL/FixJ family response regulator